MSFSDQFFRALRVAPGDRRQLNAFAERSGVPVPRLRHYNDANILPSGADLPRVLAAAGITELELMLAMGHLSRETLSATEPTLGPWPGSWKRNQHPTPSRRLPRTRLESRWKRTWAARTRATTAWT